MDMKTLVSVMAVVVATAGLAEPEKPEVEVVPPRMVERDLGLYVFPPEKDPMLKKLMGEMLKEAEQDRKEMEAPVELPKLDAPELQRLLRGYGEPPGEIVKRWMLGVILQPLGDEEQLVVRRVMPGSAAAEAELQAGDILLDVNGIRLRNLAMMVDLLQVVEDQEVELAVRRGDKELKVKVTARLMDIPRVGELEPAKPRIEVLPPVEVLPPAKIVPNPDPRDDEVLKELRGMRGLMEEMLKELKRQGPPTPPRSRVRRVPNPPDRSAPSRPREVPPPKN
jgi:hypothetical protein